MWYDDHMSGWGYALMGIGTVLFWGLVIAGIVVLVRYLGRGGQQGDARRADRPTAEQVLAERFARGEIDEPQRRSPLQSRLPHNPPPDPFPCRPAES
jgi:putative membrane protein